MKPPKDLMQAIFNLFGVTAAEIKSKRRHEHLVFIRAIVTHALLQQLKSGCKSRVIPAIKQVTGRSAPCIYYHISQYPMLVTSSAAFRNINKQIDQEIKQIRLRSRPERMKTRKRVQGSRAYRTK